MAYATMKGRRYLLRVTQDLAENWSVEAYPEPPPGAVKRAEPFKNWPSPLVVKVKADSREDALVCGLEQLKKLGRIDDFHLEPNERPKPPEKPAPAPAPAAAAAPAPPPAPAPAAPKAPAATE